MRGGANPTVRTLILVVCTAAFSLFAFALPAAPTGAECTQAGNEKDNTIRGTHGVDRLCGKQGKDKIYAKSGNDKLVGGAGNDHLWGRDGMDYLIGGPGWDICVGGADGDMFTSCEQRNGGTGLRQPGAD